HFTAAGPGGRRPRPRTGASRPGAAMSAPPGQLPRGANAALWTSTAAFTACFAVWTIFSIIGIELKDNLGLTETQFGLLLGTPVLTGSVVRVVLGIWADQYGGRRVFAAVMVLAAVATFLPPFAQTYPQLLLAALGVGL